MATAVKLYKDIKHTKRFSNSYLSRRRGRKAAKRHWEFER